MPDTLTLTIPLPKAAELHSPDCEFCEHEINLAKEHGLTTMFRPNVKGSSAWHVYSTEDEAKNVAIMDRKSGRKK